MVLIFLQLLGNHSQKDIRKVKQENDGWVIKRVRKVRYLNCEV